MSIAARASSLPQISSTPGGNGGGGGGKAIPVPPSWKKAPRLRRSWLLSFDSRPRAEYVDCWSSLLSFEIIVVKRSFIPLVDGRAASLVVPSNRLTLLSESQSLW
ncbi:hypothetical protein BIW11_09067 [Tropilaelaps mercedesae]|uniref:Uncharacterized protein n=1 Tax=Tropilaelaps mercedesae TaxID=418985 RepID=A0A1V9XM00_9ACAR|nr:hypothetical protein BIW11_09067 [Tropilaelaps mercedesae]